MAVRPDAAAGAPRSAGAAGRRCRPAPRRPGACAGPGRPRAAPSPWRAITSGSEVELPGPRLAALVVIDVVGDAVVADQPARALLRASALLGAERREVLQHRLPVRAHLPVGAQHLVPAARRRTIVRDQPGRRRHGGIVTHRLRNPPVRPIRSSLTTQVQRQGEFRLDIDAAWRIDAAGEALRLEAREPAAFGLVGVDREDRVVAPARMGDVIGAAAQRAACASRPRARRSAACAGRWWDAARAPAARRGSARRRPPRRVGASASAARRGRSPAPRWRPATSVC